MISIPAKIQSPSARLRHSGRCVVSALRTGSRNSSADAAHNCSTQADLAGRTRACSSAGAQTMKNAWISRSARPSIRVGQQAVGPQECSHGDRQAGDARNVQPLHEAESEIWAIRIWQLLPPLYGPHDQACAHHGRAHEADEKVQPSRFGVAEAPEMERIEHAAGFGRGPHIVANRQQFAGGAFELHVLRAHGNTARFSPAPPPRALPRLRDERR